MSDDESPPPCPASVVAPLPPSPSCSPSKAPFCRICLDAGTKGEDLLSPCRCSGSQGRVHRDCLERWLSVSPSSAAVAAAAPAAESCELCGFKYAVERRSRPVTEWLFGGPPLSEDQRHLLGDAFCFFVLTPLAAACVYLCALGARHYFESSRNEAIGLVFLASVLLLVYAIWLVVAVRFNYASWKIWKESNPDVKLREDIHLKDLA